MGKRELVLVGVFVVAGIAIYRLTAPPPPPGSEGVSIGSIFRHVQRTVHGARATTAVDSTLTAPVPPDATLLRLSLPRISDVSVVGEDRTDIAAALHVVGRGYDEEESKQAAGSVRLKIEPASAVVTVSLDIANAVALPRSVPPPQLTLTLRAPRRLSLRVDPHFGRLVASDLGDTEIQASRGETRVTGIAGRLRLTHAGGELEVSNAGSLKLSARNSRGSVKHIAGAASIEAIGGELAIEDVRGPIEIEGRNADVRFDARHAVEGVARINCTNGSLRVDGLRTEARIDGRNTGIDVAMEAPAPLTIYNQGTITVTPPSRGYTLDAVATEARIVVEDGGITPTEGAESRAAGTVRGGGPPLTLRATRGRIEIRKPAGK